MSDRTNEFVATLRISSELLRASQIAEILGHEPTSSFEKGDPASKRSPKSGCRKGSAWLLKSTLPRSEPLKEHVSQLLAFAQEKEAALLQLKSRCHIDIFCGLFFAGGGGGFCLAASDAGELARLGIDLDLDIYAWNDE